MKLMSVETGQAIQLIVMDEVRPLRGGAFLPDIIAGIAQRYRFVSFPTQFAAAQEIKFETGVAQRDGTIVPIRTLQIFNDGFLVTTAHTDDADAVLDDFMEWAFTAFQFRPPTTNIPRRYFSTIVVELAGALDRFITNSEHCSEIIRGILGVDTHLARITFSAEPGTPPTSSWQIEARLGAPFDAHRYFSSAPLSTNAHIEMLAALEQAIE
jgi:hypothetical protein